MGSLIADWLSLTAEKRGRSRSLVLENEIVQGLLRQRATSPSTAVPVTASSSSPGFQELVDSGLVREATPPGTFYVYRRALEPRPPARPPALSGRKVLLTIAFWLLVILIPVAFIQFFP